jgi:CPA2 family monovalent cation:H+ antiporter-2
VTEAGLLRDLFLLVGLAIPIVALAHRVNAPPLVGFVLAGVFVGPAGLGLIAITENIERLAELGVALLLFAVGLELSLSQVRHWAGMVFVGGGIQVGGTIAVVTAAAWALGVPPPTALFYGALAAMSSTAIVTRTYADCAELDTPHGRASVALLIFQDLCVLPLVLLLPLLAGFQGEAALGALSALFRGLVIVALLIFGGRLLAPWVLDRIVLLRDRELFTLCVGFFGIGAALVTHTAGFSLAIGAFLAGLILSESQYGVQALSDVLPFRALFSGIFFTSIGMLLEPSALLASPLLVIGLVAAVLLLKTGLTAAGVLAAGGRTTTALASGLGLAHVGEFAFLLAAVGAPLGLFRDADYQLFLSTAVLSMMAAPLLIHGAHPLVAWVDRRRRDRPREEDAAITEAAADHTIVVGYGLAGRYLARVLQAAGLRCLVIEQNPDLVRQAHADAVPVVYGDGTRQAVLEHVRLRRARTVVFAINSPGDERRGVALAREMNPAVRIVVRTRWVRSIDELLALGATDVVVEEFEASLELFARTLESYEIPINRIWRELESVRSEHYGLFRGRSEPDLRLDALKHLGIHDALELVEVEAGAAAVGEAATTLDLRKRTGAVQIAVVRDGRPIHEHQTETRYRPGDTVVLIGDRTSLTAALSLFRSSGSET